MISMFKPFSHVDVLITNEQMFSNIDEIEYHYIGKKII